MQIFLVDDHPIMRQGLRLLIENESDMAVIGEAGDGQTTIQKVRELKPDIVIMDITLPQLNGIDATRLMKSEMPGLKVIALSMHNNRVFVEEMMNAGASGYLLKADVFDELVEGIREVAKEHTFISPKVSGLYVSQDKMDNDHTTPSFSDLTLREREVLHLIAEGKASKEIADNLCITLKTVEKYRHLLKEKLNMYSTAELTKYAIQIGLTSTDIIH